MIIVLKNMIINMDNVDFIDETIDNYGIHARIFFRGDKKADCKLDEATYKELRKRLDPSYRDLGAQVSKITSILLKADSEQQSLTKNDLFRMVYGDITLEELNKIIETLYKAEMILEIPEGPNDIVELRPRAIENIKRFMGNS